MKKEIENKTRAVSVFALLVVLMTSSAHGSERDSLAKVTEFTKKSNVFSILKARDKTEIGIALGNYRRTNKTDVMFLFPGIVCTGQFKGNLETGNRAKVEMACNDRAKITGSAFIDQNGRGSLKLKVNDESPTLVEVNFIDKPLNIKSKIDTFLNKGSSTGTQASANNEPKVEPKKSTSSRVEYWENDEEITSYTYLKLKMSCGSNRAGGRPYDEEVFAVASPYGLQGKSFWVNRSKGYVGQVLYKGVLTKNALIISGVGRRSDRTNKKWNLKFTSNGDKTIGEHLRGGLDGYEGKDKWRRECTIKLDKQVTAVRAHMWANTKQRMENLTKAGVELRQKQKQLSIEIDELKSSEKSLETRLKAATAANTDLVNSLKAANVQLSNLDKANRLTKAESEKLMEEIKEKNQKFTARINELEAASKSTEETNARLSDLTIQNKDLISQNKKMQVELDATTTKNASNLKKIEKLELALKAIDVERNASKKDVESKLDAKQLQVSKLEEIVENLTEVNAKLKTQLSAVEKTLEGKLSQAELDQKIKMELDEKLSAGPAQMTEILKIDGLKWSEPQTEIGDGFTNYEATQNNRLLIANICLTNITKMSFRLNGDDVKFGVGFSNGKRAFAIPEATDALQAQMDVELLPRELKGSEKACGNLVFETPMNANVKDGKVFILAADEIIAVN